MVGLQFGISTYGVVITVSAFMLGLAGGSSAMAGRAVRLRRPLRVLALVEASVAVFALLLPVLVHLGTAPLDAAAARLSPANWHGLLALVCLLLLGLPAAAMGAGFPLLLQAWQRLRGEQPSIGIAYGSNTLGAALGALLPLWLLPALGWSSALRAVALLGLGVAFGFYCLGAAQPGAADATATAIATTTAPRRTFRPGLLFNYGVIGAASLLLEMAWVRLFSLAMLRTEYVLALILAVMLGGIGAGSVLAGRFEGRRWLAGLPWCTALGALGGLWWLPSVSGWIESAQFGSLASALVGQGLLLAALTLPVTLCLGAWLPALSARYRVSGSWLYASNAFGAALGAALYVLLVARIGSTGALAAAALLFLMAGLSLWPTPGISWGVPLVAAAACALSVMPPASRWLPQALAGSRDLYVYEDAIALTQVVEQDDGARLLLTDLRRRDASSEPTAVFVQANQARLPLLLHADPHSVLFLGVGTGISLAGSLPFPNLGRSAVELSGGSLKAAAQWFAPVNQGVLQQTHLYQDDARHFLSAHSEGFDVVIGDLFHPDLAGVGSLLSVEQFARARARLNADGVFVQWLALNQFDPATLDIVLRSFKKVFPEAQLFLDGMHLALIGPRHWQGAPALLAHLDRLGPQSEDATAGEGGSTWLGRYFGPIDVSNTNNDAANAGIMQHEWAPVIEFLLPHLHYAQSSLAPLVQTLLARRPRVEQAALLLRVPAAQMADFRRAYIEQYGRVRK